MHATCIKGDSKVIMAFLIQSTGFKLPILTCVLLCMPMDQNHVNKVLKKKKKKNHVNKAQRDHKDKSIYMMMNIPK